jgi:hypothetical protein
MMPLQGYAASKNLFAASCRCTTFSDADASPSVPPPLAAVRKYGRRVARFARSTPTVELSLKYGIYDLTQIHLQHSSGKYQRLSNQKNNCSAVRYRRHHNNESPRTN